MAKYEVKDKTFLITGGASGLGAAYAEGFLKEGAKRIALLDVAERVGKAKAESFNKTYGNKVIFVKCDVSKEDDINRAFDEVLAQFKQIDVIVNNAGMMVDSPNMWRTSSEVNWQGVVSFTMKGIKHMRKDEGGAGGTITNISCTGALCRYHLLPMYSGSKMAVLHFSQSISVPPFFENTGVRIVVMCPGATDTPLLQGLENRAYDQKSCRKLATIVVDEKIKFQSVQSMVKALLYMFENGMPGSTWLAVNNQPVEDITPLVTSSFEALENKVAELEKK